MMSDVKLIHGDCLEVMAKMPEKSVDLALFDPPYFLPVNTYVKTRAGTNYRKTLGDMSVLRGYFEIVFKELNRIIKPTGTFYVFCDAQSYPIFFQVLYPHCKYVRLLIWDKAISYNGYTWRHQHELIAWAELEKTERIPTGDGDILRCRGVLQKDRNHPAEKPIELLKKLINKSTKPGELVFDPYMGSASTGIAAGQLERDFTGIEIDEQYFAIAQKRIDAAQRQGCLSF